MGKVRSKASDLTAADEGTSSSDLSGFSSKAERAEGGGEGDEAEGAASGEAGSGEGITGVDVEVSDLVPGKEFVPTMRFGQSLVTEKSIKL